MMDEVYRLRTTGQQSINLYSHYKIDYVVKRYRRLFENAKAIMDVGIGDGHLLKKYPLKSVGIDTSSHLCKNAVAAGCDAFVNDISKPNNFGPDVDLITCFEVLEHVSDLRMALNNLNKLLLSGGTLLGSVPFNECLADNICECECGKVFHKCGHLRYFKTKGDVWYLLSYAGFDVHEMMFLPYMITGRFLFDRIATAMYLIAGGSASKLPLFFRCTK
jgi:SAM-dependent methyltransferase